MSDDHALTAILLDLAEQLRAIDVRDPAAALAELERVLPHDGAVVADLRVRVRRAVDAGELAPREHRGIRFGRVHEAAGEGDLSVDCVHMDAPGPGHTHPNGEIDLAFAVSGDPTFDGRAPGWTVYPPGSWHVPTVAGGVMDILYFLPGGAIRFEPDPNA